MNVSESYPAIHLRGLSNRILSEIGIMCKTREKPKNLNFARNGKMVILSELFLDLG